MTDRITPYKTAAEYIREQIKGQTPLVGVVLGSGLGSLADKIENPTVIPYKQIPGFPESTAIGHKGNLIFGDLAGKKVSPCKDASTITKATLCSKSPSR